MERLHEGWLVKSPPGKKTIGPWRLFKSKWRERYFVLYAPPSAQSIPGCCSALLCYYDDESTTKEYGRIDLNNCEEILTKLESDDHRNVFAVRTINKDSERTYYLAASSEEAMNDWANCLCCVLRLSGGDGIGHLPSFNDTAFNSSLPRCSILTQKTGEQTRLSNVPDTISKSASALNIRLADLTQPQTSNTTPVPSSKAKPVQQKIRKRQSILNMVIKPASGSARRPSCPSLPLHGGVQNKFQTLSPSSGRQLASSSNAQSPDSDFQNQAFTIGRPVPRFQFEPATPGVVTGAYDHHSAGSGHSRDHEDRWRFDGRGPDGGLDDGPPALPSRVTRNASNLERREQLSVTNRYRNSMEDSSTAVSTWRNSDFLDECDEGSRDPDYDLPTLLYNCEESNQTHESDAPNQTEPPEDDLDDDYSYPQFNYTSELLPPEEAAQILRSHLSVVDETEGGNDSYDYLPGCNSSSNRTSTCRSSTQMSDNFSFDDRGIYDVLPKRGSSSVTEGPGNRMSGIEPGLDDSGCFYQNSEVFCRTPTDIYDYPQHQNPNPFTDVNGSVFANGILPPLPEKKVHGRRKEEAEKVAEKQRRVAPLPLPPVSPLQSDVHNYMNASDVRMSSHSNSSSQDEGVYLPMAGVKATDSIYTPMHSPDGTSLFKPVPSESSNCKLKEEEDRRSSRDPVQEPPLPQNNEPSANGQTTPPPPHHGPALIPIRFTANSRSFKRRTPSRAGSDSKEDGLGSSAKHKENREPSPQSNLPPPLPPKNRHSKGSNYVHYAALDLEASTGDRPLSHLSDPPLSPHSGSFHSDTLYRTIDVEKTKALCELKKQTDDRLRNFAKHAPEH